MFGKQQTKIYTKENLGLLQWVWQYQSFIISTWEAEAGGMSEF